MGSANLPPDFRLYFTEEWKKVTRRLKRSKKDLSAIPITTSIVMSAREGVQRQVRHIDTGITYDSLKQAAEETGMSPSGIGCAIKEGRRTRVGFFEYV